MAKKRKISSGSASTPVTPKQAVVKEEPKTEEEKQQQTPAIADPIQQQEEINEDTSNPPNEDTDMIKGETEYEVEEEQDEEEEEEEEEQPDQEEEDQESDLESIQNILEAFPKDQLVEMLRDAAVAHKDVMKQVRQAADMDPTQRKVFVHGLGWDTTTETLTSAFSGYGEIEDLKVVMDKNTGKCKGYGFVLFAKRTGAKNALKEPQKKIGNRTAACQLASVGPTSNNPAAAPGPHAPGLPSTPQSEYTQRKIFVSNVGPDIDPKKLLEFFAKFGEVEEGPLGLDKATGRPKGFALFVYKTVEGARKALKEPHKKYEGGMIHCQKAIDGVKGPGGKQGFGGKGFPGRNHAAPPVQMPPGVPGASHSYPPAVSQPVPAVGGPGLNPALGQAITAFLATQLGVGSAAPNPGYGYAPPPGTYGAPPPGGMPPQQGSGRGGTGGYMGGI